MSQYDLAGKLLNVQCYFKNYLKTEVPICTKQHKLSNDYVIKIFWSNDTRVLQKKLFVRMKV